MKYGPSPYYVSQPIVGSFFYNEPIKNDTLSPEQIKYIETVILKPIIDKMSTMVTSGKIPVIDKEEIRKSIRSELLSIMKDLGLDSNIKTTLDAINSYITTEYKSLKNQVAEYSRLIQEANSKIDKLSESRNLSSGQIEELKQQIVRELIAANNLTVNQKMGELNTYNDNLIRRAIEQINSRNTNLSEQHSNQLKEIVGELIATNNNLVQTATIQLGENNNQLIKNINSKLGISNQADIKQIIDEYLQRNPITLSANQYRALESHLEKVSQDSFNNRVGNMSRELDAILHQAERITASHQQANNNLGAILNNVDETILKKTLEINGMKAQAIEKIDELVANAINTNPTIIQIKEDLARIPRNNTDKLEEFRNNIKSHMQKTNAKVTEINTKLNRLSSTIPPPIDTSQFIKYNEADAVIRSEVERVTDEKIKVLITQIEAYKTQIGTMVKAAISTGIKEYTETVDSTIKTSMSKELEKYQTLLQNYASLKKSIEELNTDSGTKTVDIQAIRGDTNQIKEIVTQIQLSDKQLETELHQKIDTMLDGVDALYRILRQEISQNETQEILAQYGENIKEINKNKLIQIPD